MSLRKYLTVTVFSVATFFGSGDTRGNIPDRLGPKAVPRKVMEDYADGRVFDSGEARAQTNGLEYFVPNSRENEWVKSLMKDFDDEISKNSADRMTDSLIESMAERYNERRAIQDREKEMIAELSARLNAKDREVYSLKRSGLIMYHCGLVLGLFTGLCAGYILRKRKTSEVIAEEKVEE